MKEGLGIITVIIIGFLLILALSFVGNVVGLWSLEFFGTKRADIERKIFDNTKSQVQGTIQSLSTYRLEYKTADEGHKLALREMILLEYNAFSRKDLLPYNLKAFIESLD